MVPAVRVLHGLPPYGPPAIALPGEWGRLGREGIVVEFRTEAGTWVGNFQPGLGGLQLAGLHPNKRDAVVIAAGDLWVIDPGVRTAERLLPAIDAALEVRDPDGKGLLWHTRRLSWDGFDQLSIGNGEVKGLAWSPIDDQWYPFRVDLDTGRSTGGSCGDKDAEGWEKCAS